MTLYVYYMHIAHMKIRKEIRKRSLITIKPSIKDKAARLAFDRNVSLSRLIENLLVRELETLQETK